MEVIRVENLSKLYDLGQVGTGTLSKDLNRWWAVMRGKDDPYARIGQTNDRTKKAGKDETVWALKDINFSVNQGEVLGIIGRNGAGKSTLLKIISRITTPTTGSVKIKGRIASLLEVGTGFHPEMTGRENIFMNGTLLGMTRTEIQSKLDQIIDFAGVALYIDTPVKRYSSGMQVRLAFAVAAFLEPEILIVDEVLTVGDAEFQKKAIGRMQEVSRGDGRTVLFVSHNMQAVNELCNRTILVSNGQISFDGNTSEGIRSYLGQSEVIDGLEYNSKETNLNHTNIKRVYLTTTSKNNIHRHGEPLDINIELSAPQELEGANLSFQIFDAEREIPVIYGWIHEAEESIGYKPGLYQLKCRIPKLKLYQGKYYLTIHFSEAKGIKNPMKIDRICSFEISMVGIPHSFDWSPKNCYYIEDQEWSKTFIPIS